MVAWRNVTPTAEGAGRPRRAPMAKPGSSLAPPKTGSKASETKGGPLFKPRTWTIPIIIGMLVAALITEIQIMEVVSQPNEKELAFRGARYTVEYRYCWVLERGAEIADELGSSIDGWPIRWTGKPWRKVRREPPRGCRPTAETVHQFNQLGHNGFANPTQYSALLTKIGPPLSDGEIGTLFGQLRQSISDADPGSSSSGVKTRRAQQQAVHDLAADLAHARGRVHAAEVAMLFDRVADPVHDQLWTTYCPEELNCTHAEQCQWETPWTPQGCWPFKDAFIGKAINFVFKNVNIGFCLVVLIGTLVWRGAFNAEYALIHRLVGSLFILRLLRVAMFGATTMPMINLSCRTRFRSVTNGGGCGDFLFSGHGSIIAVSLCLFWAQRAASAPRWPLMLLLPTTLILVAVTLGYAWERWHYTIDVVLGYVVTVPVWWASRFVFGEEQVGLKKERFLYLAGPIGRQLSLSPVSRPRESDDEEEDGQEPNSYRVGPFNPPGLVAVIGASGAAGAAIGGVTTPDPVFGMLEGMAVGVAALCFSLSEHTARTEL